jgi:hypothetical protein
LSVKTAAESTLGNGSIPTAPDDALSEEQARRDRNLRRIGIAFIFAIVLLAAAGLLGQKTSTVTASGDGYTLSITYPSVVRPGMDVRFEISVNNPAGFGKSLSIALNRHYFDIFDLNSLRPDADSSTSDGTSLVYTWNSPPGTAFRFSLDMYAEYGEHFGLDGSTSVLAGDHPAVTVRYHTRWEP